MVLCFVIDVNPLSVNRKHVVRKEYTSIYHVIISRNAFNRTSG